MARSPDGALFEKCIFEKCIFQKMHFSKNALFENAFSKNAFFGGTSSAELTWSSRISRSLSSRVCFSAYPSQPSQTCAEEVHAQITMLGLTQLSNYLTLKGSFSAVSKPNFASKYALESSRRDLQNALLCTVLLGL